MYANKKTKTRTNNAIFCELEKSLQFTQDKSVFFPYVDFQTSPLESHSWQRGPICPFKQYFMFLGSSGMQLYCLLSHSTISSVN